MVSFFCDPVCRLILFRENVLDGTEHACGSVLFRENVLVSTKRCFLKKGGAFNKNSFRSAQVETLLVISAPYKNFIIRFVWLFALYIMLTLVYKGGEFSFEENLPAVLNEPVLLSENENGPLYADVIKTGILI